MKSAIILHGLCDEEEYFNDKRPMSEKHWIPWLKSQLALNEIDPVSPDLPTPYKPDYKEWMAVFEQYSLDEDTILVGHSCGGGFLVRWLSENKVRVGKVALVAPWIDKTDPRPVPGFFDFKIDPDLISRTDGVTLFISTDDEPEEIRTADELKNTLPSIKVEQFSDRGHFTEGDMGTKEFPELLQSLL